MPAGVRGRVAAATIVRACVESRNRVRPSGSALSVRRPLSGMRAMTFNVRTALARDGSDAWPARRDHAASLLRFHAPDVVGIQEAVPDQLDDLRSRLAYEWVGSPRSEGDEHTPVGYDPERFALLETDTFWLSPSPETESVGWDGALPRIATWARLRERAGEEEWLAVSTHFDHEGGVARKHSAELLARRIPPLADGASVVVLGDLNCTPASPPYRTLVDGSGPFRDARERSPFHHGPDGTVHGFTGTAGERIDYVLVRGADARHHATLTDHLDGRYPSDHFPVVADLDRL